MSTTGLSAETWPRDRTLQPPSRGHAWRQYIELVRIGIRQGLRPAVGESGKTTRPMLSFMISMLMSGFLCIANARFYADLGTYFALIFTSAFGLQLVGVFPVQTALETTLELIHSKPISNRVHVAASASQRLFFAWLASTAYGVGPFIAARWYFSATWATIAGTYLLLVVGSFSFLVIAFSAILQLSRWLNYAKFKAAAKYACFAISLSVVLPSLAACFARDPESTVKFSIGSVALADWLPPVWFATFFVTDGPVGTQRVGVLMIILLAIALCLVKTSSDYYAALLQRMNCADEAQMRVPRIVRMCAAIARTNGPGRLFQRGFVLASLVRVQSAREENFGMRTASLLVPQLLFFSSFIFYPSLYFLLAVTWLAQFNTVNGVLLASSSSSGSASWIFKAAPIDGKQMKRGIEGAAFMGSALLPALLVVISFYCYYRPLIATALAMIYLVYARILISASQIVRPRLPLAGELATHPAGGMLYSILGNLGFASILLLVTTVGSIAELAGLAAAVIAVAGLALVSWPMSLWARRRIEALESY